MQRLAAGRGRLAVGVLSVGDHLLDGDLTQSSDGVCVARVAWLTAVCASVSVCS
jgi:hypothetical protein